MVYFGFVYFFLVLSTYITGVYNGETIAPLLVPYGAILYYYFKYSRADTAVPFRLEILNCLLIALFAFELDNIIIYQESLCRFFPISGNTAIYLCLIVLIVCVASLFKFIPVITKYNVYIACITILIINILFIFFVAKPRIDVYVHLKQSVEYFLSFENPYSNKYTQIYSPEQIKLFYYNDPVFLKYVPFQSVPPVSIAISTIGYLLGDIRTINAILFCLCPIFVKKIASHILPALSDNTHNKIAMISLLYPAQLHLIFNAWTDMNLGFFMIIFIYFFLNKQKVASYIALGIFLSLKQYSVIYFVPFLFIMDLKDWRLYLVTGGIILFPLIFYAVWDLNGFIDSIILYELKQPFREDSLSISVLLARYFGLKLYCGLPNIIILLSSTVISVYCAIKKLPIIDNEYKKIKLMLYLVLFQFFNFLMFSKQSFLSQYYLLIVICYLTLLFSIQGDKSNALPESCI